MRQQEILQFVGKILINGKLSGTGFIINSDESIVATAKHNIGPNTLESITFSLLTLETTFHIDEIISESPEEDIILFRLKEKIPTSIEIPDLVSSIPLIGASFVITGFDQNENSGYEYRSATGTISGITGKANKVFLQIVTSNIWKGMSGSPVLSPEGIIGMLIERGRVGGELEGQAIVVPTFIIETLDNRIKSARTKYIQDLIIELSPKQDDILDLGEFIELPIEYKPTSDSGDSGREYKSILKLPSFPAKAIIMGESGSGKSSLLRNLALNDAKNAEYDLNQPIPVLVELWQWIKGETTFTSFLENLIRGHPKYKRLRALGSISDLLDHREINLYLDGLDELADENIRLLNEWFNNIRIKVVVSCREEDFTGIRKFDAPTIKILRLDNFHITLFSEKYLPPEKSEAFLNTILIDNANNWSTSEHIIHLAQNPFFLILMLARYNDELGEEPPSKWNLLQGVIRKLWHQKRVQDMITRLGLGDFSNVESITTLLSKVAYESGNSTWLLEEPALRYISNKLEKVLKVLAEAGIIRKDVYGVRFRHPLFSEFFSANWLLVEKDLTGYANAEHIWSSTLVILASFSEEKRTQVQLAFLKVLETKKEVSDYSRGLLWALGEIGDRRALISLLDRFKSNSIANSKNLLTPIGKIANRLPIASKERQEAFDTLAKHLDELLQSSDLDQIDRFLSSGMDYIFQLWWTIDALSEIRSGASAEYMMKCLVEVAQRVYPSTPDQYSMTHPVTLGFLDGFEPAFGKIGKEALPALLIGIRSDNFKVSAICARAITRIRGSAPLGPLLNSLIRNSSPLVRFQVALTLGRIKDPEAVFYLASALRDNGVWQQGRGLAPLENITWRKIYYDNPFLIIPIYYRVADAAAFALGEIGTPEAFDILNENLYDTSGTPNIELRLSRISDDEEFDSISSLKNQEARYLAAEKSNYPLLFSMMGHSRVGIYRNDPIAHSLICRADRWKEKPISELCDFIDNSQDVISKAWAFYVLGHIGSLSLLPFIKKYLDGGDPALRSTAACALGILVSQQHAKSEDSVDLTDYSNFIVNLVSGASLDVFPGIGIGLAFICYEAENEDINLIAKLSGWVRSENIKLSKKAIDVIDTLVLSQFSGQQIQVYISPNFEDLQSHVVGRYSEEKIVDLILSTPSLAMKLGDLNLHLGKSENRKLLEHAVSWYETCLNKRLTIPAWAQDFTENDWSDLGCDEAVIFIKLSISTYLVHKPHQCVDYAIKANDSLQRFASLENKYSHLLFECFIKAGTAAFNLDKYDQANFFFEKALNLARSSNDIQKQITAWMSIQACARENADWKKVVEIADLVLNTDAKGSGTEICMAHFNKSVAFDQLEDKVAALDEITLMIEKSKKQGLIRELVEGLMFRAALWSDVNNTQNFDADTNSACKVYETIQAWVSAAGVYKEAANLVDNPELRITYLEKAAVLLDNAGDEAKVEKATIHGLLGKAKDDIDEFSIAEEHYKKAINYLSDSDPSPLLAFIMQYYGRNLVLQGNKDQGSEYIFGAISLLRELGEDTIGTEHILHELSTNPDWLIPSAIVDKMLHDITEVLTIDVGRRTQLIEQLSAMIEDSKAFGWTDELVFLSALAALINDQPTQVSANNKYSSAYRDFLNVCDTLLSFRRSTRSIDRALSAYIDARNADIEQVIINTYPEILSTESFLALNEKVAIATEKGFLEVANYFTRTKEKLSLIKKFGAAKIYAELVKPLDEVTSLYSSIPRRSRSEMREYIKSHPEILSPELDIRINILITFSRINGDRDEEGFLSFLGEALKLARERGVDETFDNLFDDHKIGQYLIDLISSSSLEKAKEKLLKNEFLLDRRVDTELEIMSRLAQSTEKEGIVESIQMYRFWLDFCRTNGIEDGCKLFEALAKCLFVFNSLSEVDSPEKLFDTIDSNPELSQTETIQLLGNTLDLFVEHNREAEAKRVFSVLGMILKYQDEKAKQAILSNIETKSVAPHFLSLIETENWEQVANLIEEMPQSIIDDFDKKFPSVIEIANRFEAVTLVEQLMKHYEFFQQVRREGKEKVLNELALRKQLGDIAQRTISAINDQSVSQQWLDELDEMLASLIDDEMKRFIYQIQAIIKMGIERPIVENARTELNGIYLDTYVRMINHIIEESDQAMMDFIVAKTIETLKSDQESKDQWLTILTENIPETSGDEIDTGNSFNEFLLLIISLLKGNPLEVINTSKLNADTKPYWEKIVDAYMHD